LPRLWWCFYHRGRFCSLQPIPCHTLTRRPMPITCVSSST